MSEIRVNTFKAEDGISAPSFPNGIVVTGIVTSTVLDNTVSGDLAITGNSSVAGVTTVSEGIFIPDNKQLKIGNTSASPDFKIYHNTTNTYIENSTGALRIGKSDNVRITDAADNTIIKSDGASAYLAYEGNDKLQSTNTGVTVTGQLTATSFAGDGSSLTGITQTTINNNADNRVITGSGTANTLEGEANLTFDGTNLKNIGSGYRQLYLGSTNAGGVAIVLDGDSNGDGSGGDYASIEHDTTGNLHIRTDSPASNTSMAFSTNGSIKALFDGANGHFRPAANNTYDLGTSSYRWRNIYTQDLQLSNEAKKDEGGNGVDGTWGDYTIQEGESDLYLINNRNGKKYKFNLTEVN